MSDENCTNKEIRERLTRARIQMLMKFPFFGTLALNFKLIEDNSIPTAATNGKDFFYNTEFISKLKDGELVFLMCHEVMHAALGHIWRRGTRNHEKFNIAADYAIHSMLKQYDRKSDGFQFAEGALYDQRFDNKSAEEIYELLPDKPTTKMGNSSKQGQGQGQNKKDGLIRKGKSGQELFLLLMIFLLVKNLVEHSKDKMCHNNINSKIIILLRNSSISNKVINLLHNLNRNRITVQNRFSMKAKMSFFKE